MSKDLKWRGFKFVGSSICYAYMQAVEMVNDHLVDCFRQGELRPAPGRSVAALWSHGQCSCQFVAKV
jgi:DNA-3-methyladenine glycosylase I